MPETNSHLQKELAASPVFTGRLQVRMSNVAGTILGETGVGATHAARAAFAKFVLANPAGAAAIAAVYLSQATNVAGTISRTDDGVVTSVTDANLDSQITTDWNKLAGIDSGS